MLKQRFRLDGRVAVITGAGTGLGQAIALALAGQGADVALAGRRQDVLEETANAVRALGRRALVVPTDVTQSDQVERLMATVTGEFGRLDILVNNAGALLHAEVPFQDLTIEQWQAAMDANLTSVFYCSQAAARRMLPQNSGNVINISSVAAVAGAPLPTYGPGKAAVLQLTRVLAMMWARNKVRVNCIVAGTFATRLAARAGKPEFLPIGRAGDPADIGNLAAFLASDASDYMTGTDFVIDGGVLADRWAPVDYVP
jgi:2-dehydro-3-deoxy-D-gluconate 5-dehydrogenase